MPRARDRLRQSWRELAFIVTFATPTSVFAATSPAERAALIDLFTRTDGVAWIHNENWCSGICQTTGIPTFNKPGTECSWRGVTCDANEHVVKFRQPSNNLTGSLLIDSLTPLVELQEFDVANNSLSGSLPSFQGLFHLKNIVVQKNNFSGTIPNLSDLTALVVFLAHGNAFTGSIPSLSGLSSLQTFQVQQNQLSGQIPSLSPTLAGTGLIHLRELILNDNRLNGPLPELAGLDSLDTLDVGSNRLTGIVGVPPDELLYNGLANLCPNAFGYPHPDPVIEQDWSDIYLFRETVPWGTPWWATCDIIFSDTF